jgi:hypothetical protein
VYRRKNGGYGIIKPKIEDEDETEEAVAERIQAQKEFEQKKEFTMALGEGNFGLTKEEVEKAVQELKKE